ncbi:MAG TPA: hypothetical protein VGM78_12925, partial [Ilumatobacteraceae bacterium]
ISVTPGVTFWTILPGLALFGIGVGFASSQLTSVILAEIEFGRSGVASAATSTSRQMGSAFGVAVIGSIITVQTTNRAIAALRHSSQLVGDARSEVIAGVRALGPNYVPSAALSAADVKAAQETLTKALATGTQIALLFATVVVFLGAFLSFLIPRGAPIPRRETSEVELLEAFEPMDPDPALVAPAAD